MQTNLACRTWDNTDDSVDFLLTPTERIEMREMITIELHTFSDMDRAQRTEKFKELKRAWGQFKDVCQGEVDDNHIANFATAIQGDGSSELSCDYVVVMYCNNYVLGYVMVAKVNIDYDAPTLDRLKQPLHKHRFDKDKALNIKLLCSRKSSGIGTQLVHVCENLAIHLRCASMYLAAVPTAYGFYKSRGFAPFKNAKVACNPILDEAAENKDANKFEDAIRAMAKKFQARTSARADKSTADRSEQKFKSYLQKTSEARRAVLEGVVKSRLLPLTTVYRWVNDQPELDRQLKYIADTVFTDNNVFSDTIPMTKCLLHKYSTGGGAGNGSGGSESDATTVRQVIRGGEGAGSTSSGYDAGDDSDASTTPQIIGNKRCAPDSKHSTPSQDY